MSMAEDSYRGGGSLDGSGVLGGSNSGEVSYHRLGGRDADDPMSTMMVALSHKGWHCPECLHTSTTKGNLKSHILSGRHKLFEKSHPCTFCHRSYSTRQSLQVHVSTHHRFERDAEYHHNNHHTTNNASNQVFHQVVQFILRSRSFGFSIFLSSTLSWGFFDSISDWT